MRFVLAVTLCSMLLACGGNDGPPPLTCAEGCAIGISCPDATVTDCTSHCDRAASLNTKGGCAEAYDALMRCDAAHPDDRCSSAYTLDCQYLSAAWVQCVTAYCQANPGEPECSAKPTT